MMTGNPIFKREFISHARSWKTRLLVGGYLLVLSALLLALWPSGGVQSVVTEGARRIFAMFFCTDLALLLLLIPAFSATSITVERESGTYPALFITLLSPFDIMWGKLSASILMILILTLLSMPIAALCALTGGVDLEFMMKIMLLLFMTAISYGLLGLACSAVCARSMSSVLLNYVFILLLAGATWLPAELLSNLLPPGFNAAWQIIRSISPFDAILFLLYPDRYRMTMNVELSSMVLTPYNVFLLTSCVMTVLAFLVFFRNVLRPVRKSKQRKGEVYTETKKALKRKLTFPFYLFDPLKRKKPIGRFQNPVFIAEMRSRLFSNPQFMIRTVSAIFILSMTLLTLICFQFGTALRPGLVRMAAIVFQIGVVAMLAPGVSSGLITDEITGGTFTALRMTPLSPATLIFGKLKATFFYALIFIVSSVFVLLAMAYLEPQDVFPETSILSPVFWSELVERIRMEENWFARFWEIYWRIFVWVAILLLSTMTFLCGGLFASAFSRTTAIATALAYGITGIICIVTLLPLALEEKLSYGLSFALLSFNPIVAAMQATGDSFANYPGLWIRNMLSLALLILFFLAASMGRVWFLFRRQK